jgi:peptide-methionine (R)-S-oxide reductase
METRIMHTATWLCALACVVALGACSAEGPGGTALHAATEEGAPAVDKPAPKCDSEWEKELTPEQFRVLRKHGTERAFTSELNNVKGPGVFKCAGCGLELFDADHKFDSGTGWPSFWKPKSREQVGTKEDRSFGMVRTEVHCKRCGGHLGHVFDDGPQPTGLRYCINGVSLTFEAAKDEAKEDSEEEAPETK